MIFAAPWALLLLLPWGVAAYLLTTRATATHPVTFVTLWKAAPSSGAAIAGKRSKQPWIYALLASLLLAIAAATGPGVPVTPRPPQRPATPATLPTQHETGPVVIRILDDPSVPGSFRRLGQLLNQQSPATTRAPIPRTITIGHDATADLLVPTLSNQPMTVPVSTTVSLSDHPVARAVDFTRLPPGTYVAPPPPGFVAIVSLAGTPLLSKSPDEKQIHFGLSGRAFEQSPDFVVLFLECVRSLSNLEPPLRPPPLPAQQPQRSRQFTADLAVIALAGLLVSSLLYRWQSRHPKPPQPTPYSPP